MSGKFRLTAWITLITVLMSVAIMVLMLVTNSHYVATADPAGTIVNVVWRNAKYLEYDNMAFEWDDIDYYRQGVYCKVYDANQKFLKGAEPTNFDSDSVPLVDSVLRTVTQNGTDYYVYDLYWDMEVTHIWFRGVSLTNDNSDAMRTILTLTFTIIPGILLIGILGGWFVAGGTFRPLKYIMRKVSSISGGDDLSRRIDLKRGTTEMKALANTFDNMFERLEDSFVSEKQFVSDASHELRTPTAIILAECESAKKKAKTKEDFDGSLSVIEEQGQKMSHMISQLLAITRLEQGTEYVRMKKADLSSFTEACCGEFIPKDDRGISLSMQLEADIVTEFDLGLMSRVIQNLLENAYKYGSDNGHIIVSLRRDGGSALLAVADDGIGIKKEDMENIFKRFWQADTSRGEYDGVGLGLSMVKQICQFHGGSISVQSTPGSGSTFTVRLPIK